MQKDRTGVMVEIYNKLSFSKPLDERLDHLYQNLDKNNFFQAIHNSKSIIYSLIPEMINPARALNNITDVTEDDVRRILDMFFE
ncbi:hypothetical protein ES705_48004 [subsurface metagenome]